MSWIWIRICHVSLDPPSCSGGVRRPPRGRRVQDGQVAQVRHLGTVRSASPLLNRHYFPNKTINLIRSRQVDDPGPHHAPPALLPGLYSRQPGLHHHVGLEELRGKKPFPNRYLKFECIFIFNVNSHTDRAIGVQPRAVRPDPRLADVPQVLQGAQRRKAGRADYAPGLRVVRQVSLQILKNCHSMQLPI